MKTTNCIGSEDEFRKCMNHSKRINYCAFIFRGIICYALQLKFEFVDEIPEVW